MKSNTSIYLFILLLILLSPAFLAAAQKWEASTSWAGIAKYKGETTQITIHIDEVQQGWQASLTLDNIGVSGWPSIKTKLEGDSLQLIFPSDSGHQEMRLTRSGSSLQGSWSDNRFTQDALINLELLDKVVSSREERMVIQGAAGDIGLSIIRPTSKNVNQYVILTHGSGATPRDVNRFIALRFAEHGIASVIYDKRGVGESEGSIYTSSFDDLADDAVKVANYIAANFTDSTIGFWGHSQGGWIAPHAATLFSKAAFVITSAGPMVSPAREGEWDFVDKINDRDDATQIVPLVREIVRAWHHGLRSNDWSRFKRLMRSEKNKDWFKMSELSVLNSNPDSNFVAYYKLHMDHDPLPIINNLKVPILAIYSLEDESIDSRESIDIIDSKLNNDLDIRLIIYKGLDHAMRRLAAGPTLRFPEHPRGYFSTQAAFVLSLK
jgi:alpha-beta hydrolase superfamily lysophospholipase